MSEGNRAETGGGHGVTLSPEDQARLRRRQADRQAVFAAQQRLSRRRLLAAGALVIGVAAIKPIASAIETAEAEKPERKALEAFNNAPDSGKHNYVVTDPKGIEVKISPFYEPGRLNNDVGVLKPGDKIFGIPFIWKGYDPDEIDLHKNEKKDREWVVIADADAKLDQENKPRSVRFVWAKAVQEIGLKNP